MLVQHGIITHFAVGPDVISCKLVTSGWQNPKFYFFWQSKPTYPCTCCKFRWVTCHKVIQANIPKCHCEQTPRKQ